jgi:cytochrome c oxidase subunit 3
MGNYVEYDTTGKHHPYHILNPSPWPLLGALAGGLLATGAVMYMHEVSLLGIPVGFKGIILGFMAVLAVMFFWWKDCIKEGMVEKAHSPIAMIGFRYGMMLFIASEVMFFVAFFWAFFDASLFTDQANMYSRVIHTGGHWPPVGIHAVPAFGLPLMMTMILLLSGCTVTWAHHAILEGKKEEFTKALGITVLLGFFFLCFQVYEYVHAHFGFTQGIYPSTFFMATGFHGFHVLVGTIFLAVCYFRSLKKHYTADNHFSFEAAAWYWHFVDVVWLFLFVAVYWWGGAGGAH